MASTIWFNQPLGTAFAGAKLYSYEPGTSTDKSTYPTKTDADAGTNANTNPVVLDSVGYASVWLDGTYKLTLKSSDDATTYYTEDNAGDASDVNALPAGYTFGLSISLDTGDPDHDVNVTAGEARDGSDSEDIVLASEITKRIDGSWAVGDDSGGIDTGSVAANTSYYIWLIKRSDTGVVDVLISASSTSPTLPTDYDRKVLIGYGKTDSSSNFIFVQSANSIVRYGDIGGAAGSWELIEHKRISDDTAVAFTTGINDQGLRYWLSGSRYVPGIDATELRIRVSEDAGSNWQSDTNDYEYAVNLFKSDDTTGASIVESSNIQAAYLKICGNNIGNNTGEVAAFDIFFDSPADTEHYLLFWGTVTMFGQTSVTERHDFTGVYRHPDVAVNGIQLVSSDSNMASGELSLFRMRRGG